MKVSIIGAGNVGGLAAMRILENSIADIVLVDVVPGLAKAKASDLDDARSIIGHKNLIEGTEDFSKIQGSDIIVVTAGLARKPGMTREDLLKKNYEIIKSVSKNIKELSPSSIVIVVSNPADIMAYALLKETGFDKRRVIGMGSNLDSSRFNNLISKKLNIPSSKIKALVLASHGEKMLPLPRLSTVKGRPLNKILSEEEAQELVDATKNRGAQIVSLYGQGSAYFAPATAILEICQVIIKNKKKIIPVCAYLDGEYGASRVCIGVPAIIDRNGIKKVIELDLNLQERELFLESVKSVKESIRIIYQLA
jgi:malate dehydrogenase